jgi:hypothetical protein
MSQSVSLRDVPGRFLDRSKWRALRQFTSQELIALTYINAPYPDEENPGNFFWVRSGSAKDAEAIRRMCDEESGASIEGDYYSIKREDFGPALEQTRLADKHAFYKACIQAYGENIHVAGPMPDSGRCLIVMRSKLEDDTSKPWLEAMQKAATQFSGTRPGFIAMQFNDLATDELMRPHFRRRAEILANAVCRRPDAAHVAAVFICPYRGLLDDPAGIVAPAFGLFNPEGRFLVNPADYPAFYGVLPDEEFAQRIRARP